MKAVGTKVDENVAKWTKICRSTVLQEKYSADFSSNFDDHRNFLMSLLRQQELRKKCNFSPLYCLVESKLEVMDRFGKLRVKSPRGGTSAMLL